jgi:hypothetical protein
VASGTGTRSLRIGGAWLGPSGASAFPLTLATTDTLTNASGHATRLNMMNDQTYSITATIAFSASEFDYMGGFATAYGDGGRAVIDGGAVGASYDLIDVGATSGDVYLFDLELRNNGATGSAFGIDLNSGNATCRRVVIHDVRGSGFDCAGCPATLIECEAYACNQGNTASMGGFNMTVGGTAVRCIAHDNAGSNSFGFRLAGGADAAHCISDTNGGLGYFLSGSSHCFNCDAYANAGSGFSIGTSASFVLENCNAVDNGGYGIECTSGVNGVAVNCGFGSGTAANASGTTNNLADESGSVTYAADVTPWVDPADGDFRINLAAAQGVGRGAFLQTAASYTGTVAYPDIGSAQSNVAAGGGSGGGRVCRLGL